MVLRRSAAEKRSALPPKMLAATGLVLIAGCLMWPKLTTLHGSMGPSDVDFIQGVLLGIGIACEVMGVGRMLGGRGKSNSGTPPV